MRRIRRGFDGRSCLGAKFPLGLVKGMDCVALIEKEGLKHRPNLGISPMFAEDVCNVLIAGNMAEFDQTCRNSFTNTVIGECDMPFGKARVRDGGTLYNRCIISE